jgi:hypothetical protein
MSMNLCCYDTLLLSEIRSLFPVLVANFILVTTISIGLVKQTIKNSDLPEAIERHAFAAAYPLQRVRTEMIARS